MGVIADFRVGRNLRQLRVSRELLDSIDGHQARIRRSITNLAKFGRPETIRPCVEALRTNYYGVTDQNAIDAIAAFGTKGVPGLVDILVTHAGSRYDRTKDIISDALVKIGVPAAEPLLRHLEYELSEYLRFDIELIYSGSVKGRVGAQFVNSHEVIRALGRIMESGSPEPKTRNEVLEVFMQLLKYKTTQQAELDALPAAFGGLGAVAITPLLSLTSRIGNNPEKEVVLVASINALGEIGKRDASTLQQMEGTLESFISSKNDISHAALIALGYAGSKKHVGELVSLLHFPHSDALFFVVCRSLRYIDSREAVAGLEGAKRYIDANWEDDSDSVQRIWMARLLEEPLLRKVA